MSSRLLPLVVLLVFGASVAVAALPCKTQEEALAEAVAGFFLVQGVAAARCDETVGGELHRGLDAKVRAVFQSQIDQAHKVRLGYFQRAFGAEAEQERTSSEAMVTELIGASLLINAETCDQLKSELERRRTGGWAPIEKRLQHRVQAIATADQNLCKP